MKNIDIYPLCFIVYGGKIYKCSYDELDIYAGYNATYKRIGKRPVSTVYKRDTIIGYYVWDNCEFASELENKSFGLFSDYFYITKKSDTCYKISKATQ